MGGWLAQLLGQLPHICFVGARAAVRSSGSLGWRSVCVCVGEGPQRPMSPLGYWAWHQVLGTQISYLVVPIAHGKNIFQKYPDPEKC